MIKKVSIFRLAGPSALLALLQIELPFAKGLLDKIPDALLVSLFEDWDSVEKWVKPHISLYLGRGITVVTMRGLA